MDISKLNTYEELIAAVKADYKKSQKSNENIELTWCDLKSDEDLCKEINLWTYWQGWKYAERKSKIKYLLLGQDWGRPNDSIDESVIHNVRKMNQGIDIMYLHGSDLSKRDAQTDKNLITLFKEIGYDEIDKIRYPDLFFTNFSLGYRVGNGSSGMTDELMDSDADYIKKLIELLEPENILCLGESVSKATFKMLLGVNPVYKSYNEFVSSSNGYLYKNDKFETRIYPLFHTGHYGVNVNRVGGIKQHIEDWKRIVQK